MGTFINQIQINAEQVDSGSMVPTGITPGSYGDSSHIPSFTVDVAGRITGYTALPMQVLDQGGQVFNVMAYGAVGDGSHDDTTAFQNAINDAITAGGGIVFLPPPPYLYLITSPITIQPNGGNSYIQMCGSGSGTLGGYCNINYTGSNGTAAFIITGMSWSKFYGIGVILGGGGTVNQIGFDFQFTSTQNETASCLIEKCNVQIQPGNASHHIGFRIGQDLSFDSNMANAVFLQCTVTGDDSSQGSIGWQVGGSQAKPMTFIGCSGSQLGQLYYSGPIATLLSAGISATDTTLPVISTLLFPTSGTVQISTGSSAEQIAYTGTTATTLTGCTRGANAQAWGGGNQVGQYVPNQGLYTGADDMIWVGGGGSANSGDFFLGTDGRYSIHGVRCETGQRFLQVGVGNAAFVRQVLVQGATLDGYTPPADNNGVIWLIHNTNLRMESCTVVPASGLFGANLLTNNNFAQPAGSVTIEDCRIQASNPFWTIGQGWPILLRNIQFMNADNTFDFALTQFQLPAGSTFGINGATPAGQQTAGPATAGATYGANEQNMLQTAYNILRTFGFAS